MDVEDYRAARRTRLVELAVDLGVPTDEAGAVVDRVVEAQRRRIVRAEDPDDVVVPALREEVLGRPRSRVVPLVILALAAVVLGAVAVALVPGPDGDGDDGRPARTATVPSLLGLTTDEATALLARAHITTELQPVPQCNPAGQVLGSVPAMGTRVTSDEVVTIIVTSEPGWTCPDDEDARDTAWSLLRLLLSGSARPDFAATVRVYVDGVQVGAVRSSDLGSSALWRTEIRDPVVRYVARPAPNQLGQPVVSVTRQPPEATTCGWPSAEPPDAVGDVTRLVLASGHYSVGNRCGLVVDLFTDAGGDVSAVALSR